MFVISLPVIRGIRGRYDFALAGRMAMSAMLLFTAIGHFVFTTGMAMMLPDFVPYKTETVYLTGMIEIAAAIGLLIPRFRVATAWLLIVFFLLVLPANVYAALNRVDYQQAAFDGPGPAYLWFRVPLQLFFIIWTYLSAAKTGEAIFSASSRNQYRS